MNSQQKQKIINLLTICIKAGKTVRGYDSVCEALKNKLVCCVLTAADVSAKTLKETAFMCSKYSVPVIETSISKEEISGFTGRQTAVIAVCDKGFADRFIMISGEKTSCDNT